MSAKFNDMVMDLQPQRRVVAGIGPRHPHRQIGFTLVELMVVIALVLAILMATVPFGLNWVANAHISQAEGGVLQGYQMARSVALLNANAVGSGTAAATMDLSSASSVVVQDSAGTTKWTGAYTTDVQATLTSAGCSNKLTLDNNGAPLTSACMAYQVAGVSRGTTVSGSLR